MKLTEIRLRWQAWRLGVCYTHMVTKESGLSTEFFRKCPVCRAIKIETLKSNIRGGQHGKR